MVTRTLLSLFFFFAAVVRADDPKGAQTLMELQSPRKASESATAKPKLTPPKPTHQILGKHVTYGGYLTGLFHAEDKRPFFNLGAPLDPQKDQENISYYPGTDKVQGIIFFSIKF
jgi:hypothetical protein